MKSYRASGRDKTRVDKLAKPFVGCDGEGYTMANGYHAYNLLRVGESHIAPSSGNARLTSYECLDFLSRLPTGSLYVAYFFDYDVTKILEDLPWGKLSRLMDRDSRAGAFGSFPVDWRDFQIDYLPHKEFKVRRALHRSEDRTSWSPWTIISDVGSFYQVPFLKAIEQWNVGSQEDWLRIERGKKKRASFTVEDFQEISEYNALEIVLLEELMGRFRDACISAGYVPPQWQGPGILAETMLRANGVPKSKDVPLLSSELFRDLVQFGLRAYYGGRSEISVVGPVNTPAWQQDINSAYPHSMRYVPCLIHGRWEHVTVVNREPFDRPTGRLGERFALMYGTFKRKSNERSLWYGFPVRTSQGTIVYSESGQGWYWSFEADSAIHQSFEPSEMWIYTRVCNCRPLGFVEDVYATRQALGKDGPGVVLKLGLNSLYGKTVQSIGKPKYSNAIWGSFITAFPRMMIQDFIHSSPDCKEGNCGQDILMVATDSVTTIRDRAEDYPASKALGGWSPEFHPGGMFIVQPGVYFGTSGKPTKTRGVPRTIVDAYEHEFRAAFERLVVTQDLEQANVSVPQQIFCGIRYALHRHNLKLLGQWIEFGTEGATGKLVSFDWSSKRALYPALPPTGDRSYIQTFPYEGSPDYITTPYSKNIGGIQAREDMRMAFEAQPDWAGRVWLDE